MMRYGHVIFYSGRLGYGFLKDDNSGEEYHVHVTNIKGDHGRSLGTKQPVTFEVGEYQGRQTAKNVKPLTISDIKQLVAAEALEESLKPEPGKCFNPVLHRGREITA